VASSQISNAYFLQHGGALKMLLAQDRQTELDRLYRYACQKAEAGDTAAACRLFMLLTVYDGWSFDYWFQLARCCQAEHLWLDAAWAYGRAARIRPDEPDIPCLASECYASAGCTSLASRAARAALRLCGTLPKWQSVRRRAGILLNKTGEAR